MAKQCIQVRPLEENSFGKVNSSAVLDYTQCKCYIALRPLFIYLKCFGLFYERNERKGGTKQNAAFLLRAYCAMTTVLHFLNTARCFTFFEKTEKFGHVLFMKIVITIYMFTASSYAALHFHKAKAIWKFFETWEWLRQRYPGMENTEYLKSLKRVRIILIALCFLIVIYNLVVIVPAPISATKKLVYFYFTPLQPDTLDLPTATMIFKSTNIIANYYLSAATCGMLLLFICICYILWKEFSLFNNLVETSISEDGLMTSDVEPLRIKHNRLCNLVRAADEVFSIYIGFTYVFPTLTLCLTGYNMIFSEKSTINIFMILGMIVIQATLLFLVSILAAIVNNQV